MKPSDRVATLVWNGHHARLKSEHVAVPIIFITATDEQTRDALGRSRGPAQNLR